jgi:uncharacterized protein YwqG
VVKDEIIKRLEPWIARQRRPAWKPVVRDGRCGTTASKFCGIPWIGSNAPWPDCGQCKMPLPLFLQLDLNKLPSELGSRFGGGLLQLFYCTRESCQGDGGWAPFGDDLSRVRIVQPTEPSSAPIAQQLELCYPEKSIIGWNQFYDLPQACEHDELGLRYTYDFDAGTLRLDCPEVNLDVTYPMKSCPAEDIAGSEFGDKLAGWPFWVQGVEYPHCPQCGSRMDHIFQVDSENNVPFMFGDAGCGHITQCPTHKSVVAFGWACC